MEEEFLEIFLDRLSVLQYKYKFELKDTYIRIGNLNRHKLRKIVGDICDVVTEDGVTFDLYDIEPIELYDMFVGYKIILIANQERVSKKVSFDIKLFDLKDNRDNILEYNFASKYLNILCEVGDMFDYLFIYDVWSERKNELDMKIVIDLLKDYVGSMEFDSIYIKNKWEEFSKNNRIYISFDNIIEVLNDINKFICKNVSKGVSF